MNSRSKAREETASQPLGIAEFQTGALRQRPQLFLRQRVRITLKLGDDQQTSRLEYVRDRGETRPGIGDLAEHGDQESDVERAGPKRQPDGRRMRVAGVARAGSAQAASSLLEHFELDVDEFKSSLRDGSSHIDAEKTRAWSHLEDT